jgi:Baseplate J-like protein
MVATLYHSKNEQRRTKILTTLGENGLPIVNGIDYLEVAADQKTLWVYLIHPYTGEGLSVGNLLIQGETRLRAVQVESLSVFGKLLTVRVAAPGDLSPYRLQLVRSPDRPTPPDGFDSQLSEVEFRFGVAGLSEFDCQVPPPPLDKPPPPPMIDYLAKDYASFRQLMLDRLAITLPQWKERNPADLGMMMVELVAYAADHLSYYQDAAATEAYLGTARRRVSVRRHARLLNYPMHDGCNARAWVVLQVSASVQGSKEDILPGASVAQPTPGTTFLTRVPDLPTILPGDQEFNQALNAGAQVFETLHDLRLHSACNRMQIYAWGDRVSGLPKGATQATLFDPQGILGTFLTPGKVLIFEEVKGAETGLPVDANPAHRQAVRLIAVQAAVDPLYDHKIVNIEWSADDALPFACVVSTMVGDRSVTDISVVWGNVVLVDHGRTVGVAEQILEPVSNPKLYRPRLQQFPLTQQRHVQNSRGQLVPFDSNPAPTLGTAVQLQRELENVRPAIVLIEETSAGEVRWYPQPDLLNSDRFARDFVVETEEDGRAYLRFGDGVLGRLPTPGTQLKAIYRVGNGQAGNVGAEAIAHIFPDPKFQDKIDNSVIGAIRNPLPAKGGIDPEPVEQVRLYAPQAFRSQQRAVTEQDYGDVAQRFPTVRRALATRRWTGSWYTIFITVDRDNALPVTSEFKQELSQFLDQFRLTGQDIEIEAPRFVPLEIALTVQVLPDYFPDQVKEALLQVFSNTVLPDGQLGFFHPDRFTFGQPVYLSNVIEKAMQVKGVRSLTPKRFQRLGMAAQQELERGQITLGHLEIAQLDNDPSRPEQGNLTIIMESGL